jgi:hemerythrin-like domain-containing protein
MSRINIFNQVHKGLRAMLYDTALTLQQTYFADGDQSDAAVKKVRTTADMVNAHTAHEDHFIFPAIRDYEPSLVDVFTMEHLKNDSLSEKLLDSLVAHNHAIKPESKTETGQAIIRAFQEFMVYNLQHMSNEESVLNEILWRYYSDEEIDAISRRISRARRDDEAVMTTAWMMRGLSNTEISNWLKTVETTASWQLFAQLYRIAEKELPRDRFRKVLEIFAGESMVA